MIINKLHFSSTEGVSLAEYYDIFIDAFGTINFGLLVVHLFLEEIVKS